MGAGYYAILMLEEPQNCLIPAAPGELPKLVTDPPEICAYMQQGNRECEPHIVISINNKSGADFTLSEARNLAGALSALVGQAMEARDGAR